MENSIHLFHDHVPASYVALPSAIQFNPLSCLLMRSSAVRFIRGLGRDTQAPHQSMILPCEECAGGMRPVSGAETHIPRHSSLEVRTRDVGAWYLRKTRSGRSGLCAWASAHSSTSSDGRFPGCLICLGLGLADAWPALRYF